MIWSHESWQYRNLYRDPNIRRNGAYFYSREIVERIIPNVKTDRNWMTINIPGVQADHSIIFIHDNKDPERRYKWLSRLEDLVLVCSFDKTAKAVEKYGKTIVLPLSVDVEKILKFKTNTPHTKDCAFAGRKAKAKGLEFPIGCDFLAGMPRDELLTAMQEYKTIYAVGRCAIEARILGCDIGVYDPRYPDPSIWEIHDNLAMVPVLQAELDKIDGVRL